jgi:hypothetical protein
MAAALDALPDRVEQRRERLMRSTAVIVAVGALVAVAVGLLWPAHDSVPAPTDAIALRWTFASWARIALTTCSVLCGLYVPGLLVRAWLPAGSRWRNVAFVWVPGFLYLTACGLVAWALAAYVDLAVLTAILSLPMPLLYLVVLRANAPGIVFQRGERGVAVIMLCLLLVGIGKATWSQGPTDELYGGTVSRTLAVGNRSDSRVPYHSVQLVANAASPYSQLAQGYYNPWLFSDRSPMAGLATVNAVFSSGAVPPVTMPDQPWVPFDPEGFAAYRIAMMAFAATIVFSVYGALRSRLPERLARGAVVLVALSPFIVHEVYFTWPKLLSASFAFVAVLLLSMRKPWLAGLAMGLAYLAHPAAIFVVPTLLLGLLVVMWREPELLVPARVQEAWTRDWLKASVALVIGVLVVFLSWRVANQGHVSDRFFNYLEEADGTRATSAASWISTRFASIANTFVPFRLLIADYHNWSISSPAGPETVVKLGFLYWATIPFGVGLLYFPVYLFGIWRFACRKVLMFVAVLALPLAIFWLYWGDTITGMLREGLHFWFITSIVLAFFGCTFYAGRRAQVATRWLATSRVASCVVMIFVPTIGSTNGFGETRFRVGNGIAFVLIGVGLLGLAGASFRWLDPARLTGDRPRSPAATSGASA